MIFFVRVCGSYAALNGGFISDGLHDFTGGAYKAFNLRNASDNLWDLMDQAVKRRGVMGCGTPPGVIIHTLLFVSCPKMVPWMFLFKLTGCLMSGSCSDGLKL